MKAFIFVILISSFLFGQMGGDPPPPDGKMRKRMEQLERIKLIELLNMDEETTLKFFARREQMRENHRLMMDAFAAKAMAVEEKIKQGEELTEKELDDFIALTVENNKAMCDGRSNFISSLNDILTKEQIVKYVLFEDRFKQKVRDMLFEHGPRQHKRRWRGGNNN